MDIILISGCIAIGFIVGFILRYVFAKFDANSVEQRADNIINEAKIKGDAKAKEIQLVYDAIKNASPDEKLVQLKSLETLSEVAKGSANKIFIPFEATSALSSLGALKDVVTDGRRTRKRKTTREEAEKIVEDLNNEIDNTTNN